MRVGITLSTYDMESGVPASVRELADEARRAEELGFDSIWLMDHYFVIRDGRRVGGFEPLTSLGYIAAVTSRIRLGILVLCNTFRDAGQLAREVATLSDAAGDRLILGVGCGSFQPEHDAFGVRFDHRVSRLEETLQVLPPLLRGESVSFQGRFVRLAEATITPARSVPPIWAAAFGPRMVDITSRLADGWTGGWDGPDPARFGAQAATVGQAVERSRGSADGFERVATLLMLAGDREVVGRAERFAPDAAPIESRVIFGGPEDHARALAGYRAAGATYAVVAPTPRQFGRFDAAQMDEVAKGVQLFGRS